MVRSESEAFGWALAIAGIAIVAVAVAVVTTLVAGIVVLVVALAALVGWRATRRPPDTTLRDAERTGHRRAGHDRRVLVVADAAVRDDATWEEILRSARRPVVEVLAPVLQPRTHTLTTDVDRETELARQRLRETLASARAHGVAADGVVGDPVDPIAGLADELRRFDVDEVVLATAPGESSWVEERMLRRLREQLGVPLVRVDVEVPQPSDPTGPVVPDAPVPPAVPDPGTPGQPEEPSTVPTPPEPPTPIEPDPTPEPQPDQARRRG